MIKNNKRGREDEYSRKSFILGRYCGVGNCFNRDKRKYLPDRSKNFTNYSTNSVGGVRYES